ncbi:hypothetical protein [Halosegnis longus]|uniref:Uncharacterized protein n=1 Tax=Halosegnis longus TaxID=2216012 RepID=A0AAJ4RA76_9EURY|nr:hypothetical protein Nmn1133_10560 [Salella cibi]
MVIGHLAGALTIARTELRRSVRKVTGRLSQILGLGVGLFIFTAGALLLSYLLVTETPDLSGFTIGAGVRSAVAFQWLFVVAIITQRVVTVNPRPDADAHLLTTVRPATAVFGLVLAETARILAYIGVPLLIVTLALAYATGSVATVPLVALAVILLFVSGVVLAHVIGLTIKLAVARIPVLARHRTVLGTLAVVLLFGGYTVVQSTSGGTSGLGIVPVGWVADLAALALPIGTSPSHAAGGLVMTGFVILAGVPLASRIATAFWFGDSVTPEIETEEATVDGVGSDPLASGLGLLGRLPLGSGQSGHVARRTVLLARRAPAKLSYLILPFIVAGSFLIQAALGELTLPAVVFAPGLAVALPWVAGAAFTLNPLGDEGRVLPLTLTSPIDGRTYLRGLIRPGIVIGGLCLPAVPILALATGHTPVDTVLVLAVATVGVLTAAAIAAGIGMVFPRTDTIRVARGQEASPPTMTAMLLYTVCVGVTVALPIAAGLAPGLVRTIAAVVVGGLLAFPFAYVGGPLTGVAEVLGSLSQTIAELDTVVVQSGGLVVPVVLGVVAGLLSARFAARYFERYML